MKIALLSSYTSDIVQKEAGKQLSVLGISSEWYVAPFNQYRQEILGGSSGSKEFAPDIVLLALDGNEMLSSSDEVLELIVAASKQYPSATILVHNCVLMCPEPMQLLEWNSMESVQFRVGKINTDLAELAQKLGNVYVLDLQGLVLMHGAKRVFDSRFYYLAKMQYSEFGVRRLAEQLTTAVSAIVGRRKKCLVLDLDNTLWGGIIGEVGIEHIKLSNDGEGKAFYDFQRAIEKLYDSGIVLAICSKNDEGIALDAVRNHPYMLLGEGKFAAIRINWADKAENIASIAKGLNLGLDSFVYLDDSPHERELVRTLLPEVTVPDLPDDCSQYPQFLAELPFFETFSMTAEDAQKGKLYVAERQRRDVRNHTKSLSDYYESLGTIARIKCADDFSIPRIAQLTQKTNQFNLSIRRYTEGEVRSLVREDSLWKVMSISVVDKLGDMGLVGAAFLSLQPKEAQLDTFLMSCRVLGRGIEQAFLCSVLACVRETGAEALLAEYIPTEKNAIVEGFLTNNGFTSKGNIYVCDMRNDIIAPPWIEIEYE